MTESLVHFHEFNLKKSDLGSMTKEEIAVLGMLSYICNELNVFARFLRLTERQDDERGPVKFASDLQFHVVLRTLSSRVFEAYEFLKEATKKTEKLDPEMLALIQKSTEEIERLGASEGHAINRNIRNETSFHYKLNTALKNAGSLPCDADASVYVNSLDGNTYFVLGESLVFFERLRRFSAADKKFEDPEILAESWIKWSLEVVMLIKDLQANLFGIVLDRAKKVPRKTHYFVKSEVVAKDKRAVMPVFIQSDQ
ncbi:hypothetical protein CLV75_4322 [Ruegeria conchae]|uniref:HEPN AbiU2-like domain-containing protein n=2 Tax=Ruegeria conchae TaxID=981384 RepID=A0A497YSQ7_9RHOB|nr:hypothetical protein CLV75_4322 [Ruegeria conchae]